MILNSDEIITYRILDIDEFFAGIFLKDKPFAKKMANIKYKSSTKSILEKYADLITRLVYKILPNKRTNTISSEVTQQLYSLLKGDYADKLEKQKLDRLEQLKYEEAMNDELLQKQIDEGKNISVDDIFSPVQYNNIKGIKEIFQENLELASIGTQEQYSAYLDTIFPNSKLKDIVYHGGDTTDFIEREEWTYFTNDKKYASNYGKVHFAILNITKGKVLEDTIDKTNIAVTYKKALANADGVIGKESMGIVNKNGKNFLANGQEVVAVRRPEQIHMLGSKAEIEGFRNFVNTNQPITVNDMFSPVEYNNYVSDSQLNNKDVSLSNEEFNSLNEQEKEYLMWSIKNC